MRRLFSFRPLRPIHYLLPRRNIMSAAPTDVKTAVKRGAFILFEGLDRSGKSTQCVRLYEALQKNGVPSIHMRFPGK